MANVYDPKTFVSDASNVARFLGKYNRYSEGFFSRSEYTLGKLEVKDSLEYLKLPHQIIWNGEVVDVHMVDMKSELAKFVLGKAIFLDENQFCYFDHL